MKSKTLEQKISDIVFSICAGGVIYLIVGYLMKTNWLSCPKPLPDLYEIVRDTLTLMAYFLAPAIALVLFSDWRLEHLEKSREEQGKQINDLIKQIDSNLSELENEIKYQEIISSDQKAHIDDLFKELMANLNTLQNALNEFDFDDIKAIKFHKKVKDILFYLLENTFLLERMFSALIKKSDPLKHIGAYKGDDITTFKNAQADLFQEFDDSYLENFGKKHKLLDELRPLYKDLKVKAVSPN